MSARRSKTNAYFTPPNKIRKGRVVDVPDDVTEYPGPATFRRHRRCLRITIRDYVSMSCDSHQWYAFADVGHTDSGLLASGSNLHSLQLYLIARFKPVWFVVVPYPTPDDVAE